MDGRGKWSSGKSSAGMAFRRHLLRLKLRKQTLQAWGGQKLALCYAGMIYFFFTCYA